MIYEKSHHEDDFNEEINHTHPIETEEEEKEETEREIEKFEEIEKEQLIGKDGHGQQGYTQYEMLVIGNQGGFEGYNCWESLKMAIMYGIDGVMVQVWKTKDGQVVVMQNEDG